MKKKQRNYIWINMHACLTRRLQLSVFISLRSNAPLDRTPKQATYNLQQNTREHSRPSRIWCDLWLSSSLHVSAHTRQYSYVLIKVSADRWCRG